MNNFLRPNNFALFDRPKQLLTIFLTRTPRKVHDATSLGHRPPPFLWHDPVRHANMYGKGRQTMVTNSETSTEAAEPEPEPEPIRGITGDASVHVNSEQQLQS